MMTSASDQRSPPYYAVIFSSQRKTGTGLSSDGDDGYDAAAARMAELSRQTPGFLGMEHARSEDGFAITVCYWDSPSAIAEWKANAEHQDAQARGKTNWYEYYNVRIATVTRAYTSPADKGES